jgi:hypothetical protein
MGHFYTNFSILESDQAKIVGVMKALNRRAFLASHKNGWTTIYDEGTESQYIDSIKELGTQLSHSFQCPAVGFRNHDDDVLEYWLFDGKEIVDYYNSWPGCFEPKGDKKPEGGNAKLLCQLFDVPTRAPALHRILHEEEFAFEFQRHEELAKTLGLDSWLATMGFVAIRTEDMPEEVKNKITATTPMAFEF